MVSTSYVYFVYSGEQIKEKNSILASHNKKFKCGIVIVNGQRKQFTQIITNLNQMSRYVDTKIICEGILGDFTYNNPEEE